MPALLRFLTIVHFVCLAGLSLYGAHRLWLLWAWARQRGGPPPPRELPAELPMVTVQLPVYNERFVAARLVDAAAALDWPADRLEVQVLDDSTDDTAAVVDGRAAWWRAQGVDVQVLRRSGREGYKAGALAHGLGRAKGELVAVFDADFVPDPDFLRRTVPAFADPGVGMAQARWGFLNAESTWLTRVQALLLEPHFRVEHQVRSRRGLFFNFNGTAGVWRRSAIADAGGWQADTVTEDLDLSYRAQLAGWRFVYLDDVVVPSELPVTLASFRAQQHRWARGSLQTARKILPRLLRGSLPAAVKVEASFHLLANLGWLLGALVTLTLYPTVLWRVGVGPYELLRLDLPLLVGSSGAILLFFTVHALAGGGRALGRWIPLIPLVAVGLAPSVALGVVQGLFVRGGVFSRTPKFGVKGRQSLPRLARLYALPAAPAALLNAALVAYTLLPVAFAYRRGSWAAVPFSLLFTAGFLFASLSDLREAVGALADRGFPGEVGANPNRVRRAEEGT